MEQRIDPTIVGAIAIVASVPGYLTDLALGMSPLWMLLLVPCALVGVWLAQRLFGP